MPPVHSPRTYIYIIYIFHLLYNLHISSRNNTILKTYSHGLSDSFVYLAYSPNLPVRPTSPIKTVSISTGMFLKLEAMAVTHQGRMQVHQS